MPLHTKDHCPYCNSRRLNVKKNHYVGECRKYDLIRCKDCERVFEQWFKIIFIGHQKYSNNQKGITAV